MAENESTNGQTPAPAPQKTLVEVMQEIEQVIKAFTVTPQVVNVAFVRYADPAGKEVLLAVSLFRAASAPAINVSDSLSADPQFAEASERYRIFASAASEKEGIELIMKRMTNQAASRHAQVQSGEGEAQASAPESSIEGTTEEGEPEGKTVTIG